jgi:excisionase family DNA binding protein
MTRHRASHDSADDDRLFLTATEVGQQLGLGKSRVYALAADGLLPAVRLGRRMWFPRRGLEALADAAIERAEERMASSTQGAVGMPPWAQRG